MVKGFQVFHGLSSFTEQIASLEVTSGSSVSSIVSIMYGYIHSVSVQYLIVLIICYQSNENLSINCVTKTNTNLY